MRSVAIIAGAIFLLAALPAQATKLSGKVVVTKELRKTLEKDEKAKSTVCYWNEENGSIPVQDPYVRPNSDLVAVILPEGAEPAKPEQPEIVKVRTGGLERNIVTVRPGGTIRFQNVDQLDHELYSPNMPEFKAEKTAGSGGERTVDFPQEGIFEVRCRLMPHFQAFVVVTSAPIIVSLESDGSFNVDELEPGKYTLKIAMNGKWIHTQSFEVSKSREMKLPEVKLAPKSAEVPKKDETDSKVEKKDDPKSDDRAK